MYNTQIDDLKVMLDNMNKKYNQLKISSEGLLQENDDMKKKLNKKDFDAVANNEQINRLEDEMRQLANQLSLVETEKHKLHNQLQVSFIVTRNCSICFIDGLGLVLGNLFCLDLDFINDTSEQC